MAAAPASKPGVNGDGWTEYRRLVLAELERLSRDLDGIQSQVTATNLSTAQAINAVKDSILDKLATAIKTADCEYQKAIHELEARQNTRFEEFKKNLKKQEKDIEKTDEKTDKTDKTVTGLKAQAVVLGALAGFLVALGSLIVSIIFKKD